MFLTKLNKKTYLAISLGLLLIFILIAYTGFLDVWQELKIIDPSLFLIIFVLTLVSTIIAGVRFHSLLYVHGYKMRYRDVYPINTVGILGNLLTPGVRIGGDFLRIVLLKNHGVKASRSVTSILLVKILDSLIAISFTVFLILLIFGHIDILLLAPFLTFCLCFCVVIFLVRKGYIYSLVRKVLSIIKIKEKPKKFDLPKKLALVIVLISFARWLIFGLQDYLVMNAFGLDLSFITVLAIFSVNLIIIVISPLPFGLGISEAVTAGLYSYFGASLGAAMSIALITRTYVTFALILLGVYSSLRIGWDTIKKIRKF
jgi:hypothetical protein